jgi:hypothetical protein
MTRKVAQKKKARAGAPSTTSAMPPSPDQAVASSSTGGSNTSKAASNKEKETLLKLNSLDLSTLSDKQIGSYLTEVNGLEYPPELREMWEKMVDKLVKAHQMRLHLVWTTNPKKAMDYAHVALERMEAASDEEKTRREVLEKMQAEASKDEKTRRAIAESAAAAASVLENLKMMEAVATKEQKTQLAITEKAMAEALEKMKTTACKEEKTRRAAEKAAAEAREMMEAEKSRRAVAEKIASGLEKTRRAIAEKAAAAAEARGRTNAVKHGRSASIVAIRDISPTRPTVPSDAREEVNECSSIPQRSNAFSLGSANRGGEPEDAEWLDETEPDSIPNRNHALMWGNSRAYRDNLKYGARDHVRRNVQPIVPEIPAEASASKSFSQFVKKCMGAGASRVPASVPVDVDEIPGPSGVVAEAAEPPTVALTSNETEVDLAVEGVAVPVQPKGPPIWQRASRYVKCKFNCMKASAKAYSDKADTFMFENRQCYELNKDEFKVY